MKKYVSITLSDSMQKLLFWSILLFAFLIRIIRLESVPTGINQDEAMAAVDAWALSQYGTDRFGMQWPVHFTAWEYGQMSVLLSYLMIPFIKIFGFTTFAIRLPMVFASVAGVALIYLIVRKLFSGNLALAAMAFAAVNPWHFMQSRWSLDCNLFPHVFLLAFYLLLKGFEKRKFLYISMIFFGLTFYCYGVAVYTVPVFLFAYAAWCLWHKEFSRKDILISVCIFLAVALPEILVMVINMFGLPTIETPIFTIPYFPDSMRSNDILFLNFSWEQLQKNAQALLKQAFLQNPDPLYNALPDFGPMYHLSIPFMFVGIWQFTKKLFSCKNKHEKTLSFALFSFLIASLWAGLVTYQVNINRINIIFYPLIIFTVYGISRFIERLSKYRIYVRNGFIIAYSILAISFMTQYFGSFATDIRTMFNVDFSQIIREADQLEDYDTLYVSSNVGWQTNYKMAEILTQYSCKIDALYYQEQTNETGGRTLLPYSYRYRFVTIARQKSFDIDALYVLHRNDLQYTPEAYDVILTCGDFLAVDFR
ncbi:MAG: glycosyltransferase family 39 protein [Lachnospiraceae bacterium]|nr:glycosyltransferase family 39 protein [Lachnospiraceae bacterium]